MSFESSARFKIAKGQQKQKYRCKDENVSNDSDSTCSDNNCDIENRPKLKVELCRNFLDNKVCPYQSRCKFAHGLKQLLQNTDLYQNFRTKKCKIFYEKGYCKFGQRCNFKHTEAYQNPNISSQFLKIFKQFPQALITKKKQLKFTQFSIQNQQTNNQNQQH